MRTQASIPRPSRNARARVRHPALRVRERIPPEGARIGKVRRDEDGGGKTTLGELPDAGGNGTEVCIVKGDRRPPTRFGALVRLENRIAWHYVVGVK